MSIASRAARAVQRSTTLPTLLSNKLSYGSDPLRSATPISGMTRPPFSGVVCVRASLCSDTVMTRPPFSGPTLRTTIAPSKSSVTIISPLRAAVRYRLDPKRIIAAPMRIAPGPAATGVVESLGDLGAWRWRSRHFGHRQTTSGLPPGTDIVRPTRHEGLDLSIRAPPKSIRVASPLAAARLGGAPSVRQVSARGHAGWTVWIAVVRLQKT